MALPLRCCDQSCDPADTAEASVGPCRCLLPALEGSSGGHEWAVPSLAQKESNTAQKTPVITSASHQSHRLLMSSKYQQYGHTGSPIKFPF